MKKAMKQLEKNDPEFFKYLQQNDKDLLEFGEQASGEDDDEDMDMDGAEEGDGADEDDEEEDGDEDEDMEGDEAEEEERAKTPVTRKMLREWQEGMLKVRVLASHFSAAYRGKTKRCRKMPQCDVLL
jgi:nucleolar complex protein 2